MPDKGTIMQKLIFTDIATNEKTFDTFNECFTEIVSNEYSLPNDVAHIATIFKSVALS